MNSERCIQCNKTLTSGDFNNICQECRTAHSMPPVDSWEEVIITKLDDEFIARHRGHKGIVGVGNTEAEALTELVKALGALVFVIKVIANRRDKLLELYRKVADVSFSRTLMPEVWEQIKEMEKPQWA